MFNKKEWMKEYQKTDKFKKYQKEYKLLNKEKLTLQNSIYIKKRRKDNPEKYRVIDKENREKYSLQIRARVMVYDHIKSGKLKKPKNCSVCFKYNKIEAHHKDYSKPLDVTWLCKKCHVAEHK